MADTRAKILSDMEAYQHTNNMLFKKARDKLMLMDRKEVKPNELDLNRDGVVDKKDRSLAAKLLGSSKKKK